MKYINHLANVPEQWEVEGVHCLRETLDNTDINLLTGENGLHIHIQNLSSSKAIHKIFRLKEKYPKITIEISGNYLSMTDEEIEQG
jgi:dihydroorotase-like cyclic amidohydrolase